MNNNSFLRQVVEKQIKLLVCPEAIVIYFKNQYFNNNKILVNMSTINVFPRMAKESAVLNTKKYVSGLANWPSTWNQLQIVSFS